MHITNKKNAFLKNLNDLSYIGEDAFKDVVGSLMTKYSNETNFENVRRYFLTFELDYVKELLHYENNIEIIYRMQQMPFKKVFNSLFKAINTMENGYYLDKDKNIIFIDYQESLLLEKKIALMFISTVAGHYNGKSLTL